MIKWDSCNSAYLQVSNCPGGMILPFPYVSRVRVKFSEITLSKLYIAGSVV